jgi:hypothetical protein
MRLTQNLIEFLLSTPEVQALVASGIIASSVSYPRGYIFEGRSYEPLDNLSRSSVIVIYSNSPWSPPRRGSGLEYPLVELEIWAAPSKGADGSVAEFDAEDVIDEVYRAIKPYVHLVNRTPENGARFEWGSSSIVSSEIIDGPIIRPVNNTQAGTKVASIGIGVQK